MPKHLRPPTPTAGIPKNYNMSTKTVIVFAALMLPLTIAPRSSSHNITWKRGPDIPLPRGGYSAAAFQGGVLVAGGVYWKAGEKLWTDRVDFYNPHSGKWSQWPSLPQPLAYGGTVRIDGTLYLMGGGNGNVPQRNVYKLVDRQWLAVAKTPVPFFFTSAVSVGSRVYLLGGTPEMDDLSKGTNEAWAADVRDWKWKSLPPFPGPPRTIQTAAAAGSSVYLFGGVTQRKGGPLQNLDDAYRLDTITGSWTTLKQAPQKVRAGWAETVDADIYLLGGYSDRFLDTVYLYDPSEDEYTLVSNFQPGLADTEFLHHQGTFYGISGEDKGKSRFPGLLLGTLTGKDE